MAKRMLIDATHPEETRVVVLDGNKIEDFDFESASKRQIAGNIYLAKVTRVEPSLQAAFVEYGGNRHGFLAFSEIHPDYYQILKADREALIAEEAEAARRRAEAEAEREAARAAEREARAAAKAAAAEAAAETADEDAEDADVAPAAEMVDMDAEDDEPAETSSQAAAEEEPTAEATPETADQIVAQETHEDIASESPEPASEAPIDETEAPVAEDGEAEPAVDSTDAAREETDTSTDEAPQGDDEDPTPRSIAEAAGADDEDRVEEDYAPAAKRPEDEASAETPASGEADAADAASAAESEAPAEEEVAEPEPIEAAKVEIETEVVAAPGDAEAPLEDDEASDVAETESGSADASDADDASVGDDAPSDGASDAPATAESSGETDAADADGDDEDGGRKRRRSRRGGRSRRSRRGKAKGEGDEGVEADEDSGKTADAPSEAEVADGAVEADAGDDMAEAISLRRIAQKRYKIQEVIKVRQILLVQVVKEERGNKGAALTTYLSLAGRYCVLMPNTARGGGISRKITNAADRKKLKDIAGELEVPQGMGLIVRTAGAKRSKAEIQRDYEYLLRQWARIRENTLTSVAPTLIYEEGSLVKRVIRDLYSGDVDGIHVEGDEGWREARDYMGMLMPGHARRVIRHVDPTPLFAKHGVEQELDQLFNPTVQLKSGGYIVIGVTEALVAIDINSGKSTKEGSIEDTALKTNLEAADEIARQLKLRDLAGLIVIDFIDMEESRNNRAVEKRMKERLKGDRARIQIGRISGFGLMEMSRQRLRPGMIEATTAPCPHCHGTGVVRSDASLSLSILRRLSGEAGRGRAAELVVRAPLGAASYLFNEKREHLAELEARFEVSIRVEADPSLASPKFDIDRSKTRTREPAAWPVSNRGEEVDVEDAVEVIETPEAVDEASTPAPVPAESGASPIPAPDAVDVADDEDEAGGRRRRGRRGGRRRRKGEDAGPAAGNPDAAEPSTEDARADAPPAEDGVAATDIPPPRKTRRRRKPKAADDAAIAAESPPVDAAEQIATGEAPEAENAGAGADDAAAPIEEPGRDREEEVAEPASSGAPEPEVAVTDASEEAAAEPTAKPEEVADPVRAADDAPAAQGETEEPPAEDPKELVQEEIAPAEAPLEAPAAQATAEPSPPKPKRKGWWSL